MSFRRCLILFVERITPLDRKFSMLRHTAIAEEEGFVSSMQEIGLDAETAILRKKSLSNSADGAQLDQRG